ncbi:uncharacterized protein LOC127700735 [Mytilus californianus]|uniref:uncharacterized protein LOC127700735 n=1 Tax=Mytilus californianus TaxID=6549 RepID=UPI00224658DB|nr:uncharacterized protein LOC127700735 [Mytilus californianus]XP_052060340.1 uncharacterized protein LOC127700735 [Mytilus californianus]
MDTSGGNSPIDKKKKVQYVNDFHTGKTKVIEKNVNLARSLNSYFDNNTCSSLVSTSSKEDDDKGRSNESLDETSRPILNDSQSPERYTDGENLALASHENELLNNSPDMHSKYNDKLNHLQEVDLKSISKEHNLGANSKIHSRENTDGYCDILWKDSNEINSSTNHDNTTTGQSVIELSKLTGQEHEIIKTSYPLSNQVSDQNTVEIFDIIETEDILVNMNEGDEHRIYSTDNSDFRSQTMDVLAPSAENSKFNSENSISTNITTELPLCNKIIDENKIRYLTTEQTAKDMMNFPSRDSVFPRPKDHVEHSLSRYQNNEVRPKQLKISDEIETEVKLSNVNVSYEIPEKKTNSMKSEDENSSTRSIESDNSNGKRTNEGIGGELSNGLVVATKNEINGGMKQDHEDKEEICGQPKNLTLNKDMNSMNRNLSVQRQSLGSQTMKDCGTQTDFVYSSFNETYNILCEKCGNTIDMKEILLHLLKYPLTLKNGHLCNESEEATFVDENHERAVAKEENMPTLQIRNTSMDNNTTSRQGKTCLDKNTHDYNETSFNLSGMPCQKIYVGTGQTATRPPIEHSENQELILKKSFSPQITNKASEKIVEDKTILEKHPLNDREHSSFYAGLKVQRAGEEFQEAVEGFQDVYTSFPPAIKEEEGYIQDQDLSSRHELYSPGIEVGKSVIELVAEANKPYDDTEDDSEEYESNDTQNPSKMLPPRQKEEEHTYNNNNQVLKGSFQTVHQTKSYYNPLYIQNHTNKKGQSYNKISCSKMKPGNKAKYKCRHKRDMMDKLSSFAYDNSLNIHNVSADGNCMFSAVVDQLWINGNFRFTQDSLRKEAVEFLRKNPTHRDGTHLELFLATESWEEYLRRMERKGEWGDHMILQGVSEVTNCRIIVINSDIVKTELNPWHSTFDEAQMDIVLLGHMGEYHYVSLRPSNYQEAWAIRAKIKFLNEIEGPTKGQQSYEEGYPSLFDITPADTDPLDEKEKTDHPDDSNELQKQPTDEDTGNGYKLPKESEIDDQPTSTNETTVNKVNNTANNVFDNEVDLSFIVFQNTDLIQRGQSFKATEALFDKDEDLKRLVMETDYIDPLSAIPIQHLSFYLRQLIEPADIYIDSAVSTVNCKVKSSARKLNIDVVVYGSVGEGLVVYPDTWHCCHSILKPQVLFYMSNVVNIVYEKENGTGPHSLLVNTDACSPGFVRLAIPYPEYFEKSITVKIDETVFLDALTLEFTLPIGCQRIQPRLKQGIECQQWPESLTSEWHTRKRPSGFPDTEMLKELSSRACFVRKCRHHCSLNPDIEWQFVFPTVETDLLQDMMNDHMKYIMRLFKMIVEFQTEYAQRRLKTNHLKTVMLYTCENLPISVWSNNVGGAILYLVASLMAYLHRRHLPHYVMESVNLIDNYSDLEIDDLLRCLEQIRLFPFMSFNIFAEDSKLPNQWIIDPIVNDLHRFRNDKDHLKSAEEAFCPTLIELSKRLVMYGVQYFWKGFKLTQRAYDRLHELEKERKIENPQTFEQFMEPFVYAVEDPINRYFFTDFVDRKLGTSMLHKMVASDHVRSMDTIVEKEVGGHYNEFPIPDGSKLDDVEYMESFAKYLMTLGSKESGAHFLRCGITIARSSLTSETIDTSEITEEEIKTQITEKNLRTVDNLNIALHRLYNNLIECYNEMDQTIMFQEFIHDYEDLVETLAVPCYYNKLATTWEDLGNNEKADLYRSRFEEYRQRMQSTRV